MPGVVAEPLTVDSADGATRSKPTDGPEVQPPAPGRPQISINTINSPSAVPLPGIATPASPGGPAITAGPAAVFGIPDRPQQRPSPGGNTPESPLPSPGGQETPAPGNEGPGSVESEGVPSQGDQGTPSSDNQGGSQIDTSPGQSQDQPSQPSPQPGPEDQSPAPGDDNPTMPSIPPVVIAPPIHTTITVGGIPVEVSSDQVILPSTTYFPSSGAAPATVTISNTPVVFNPSQIIAGDSTIAIPSQEPETAGLPTIPATPPVYIVGSQTFEVNPASEVVIAGQTVRPGSPGVVVGSQTFSLAPSASAIVVGGETYQLTLPAFPSPTGALATPKITVGGETYTANPAGEFVIGTQTITPGSPAVTISGTPVSVAPQTAPEITFGTHTYTAKSCRSIRHRHTNHHARLPRGHHIRHTSKCSATVGHAANHLRYSHIYHKPRRPIRNRHTNHHARLPRGHHIRHPDKYSTSSYPDSSRKLDHPTRRRRRRNRRDDHECFWSRAITIRVSNFRK